MRFESNFRTAKCTWRKGFDRERGNRKSIANQCTHNQTIRFRVKMTINQSVSNESNYQTQRLNALQAKSKEQREHSVRKDYSELTEQGHCGRQFRRRLVVFPIASNRLELQPHKTQHGTNTTNNSETKAKYKDKKQIRPECKIERLVCHRSDQRRGKSRASP